MPFPFQHDFQGKVWKMPFLATFFTFCIFFSEPDIKDETIKKYYINVFVLNIAYKRGKTIKCQSDKDEFISQAAPNHKDRPLQ